MTTASRRPARSKPTPAGPTSGGAQTDPAVEEFMKALDHPLRGEIEAVRRIILGVSPQIHEAIKWKSPSFRTTDFFATVHLRATDGVQLVFHTGAKVKATATSGFHIDDPAGLLKWLAKDRALVSLGAGREFEARRAPFEAIVRAWIAWV